MEDRSRPRVVYDDAERALLRAMREAREAKSPRMRRVAAGVVIAIHVALLVALHGAMVIEPEPPRPPVDEAVMVVEFVDDEAPPAPPSPPEPSSSPVERVRTKPPVTRMEATFNAAPAAKPESPAPRLLNPDGSLRLSQEVLDAADAKPAPGWIEKDMSQPDLMTHESPVEYRSTRFDKYWVPDKETLGQELVRKYPALGLVLQGVNAKDRCPPRSTDPKCESAAQPAFNDDPFPDEDLVD